MEDRNKNSKTPEIQKITAKGNNSVEVTVRTVNGTTVIYKVPRKPIVTYDSEGRIVRN